MSMKEEKIGKNSSVIDVQSIVTSNNLKSVEAGYNKDADDVYDPFANRDQTHATSDFGTLIHLIKANFGSGILAVPRAFKSSGLMLGLGGTLVMGIICAHSVSMLVKCAHALAIRDRKPLFGFADMAEAAFRTGPPRVRKYSTLAKQFVTFSLFVLLYLGSTVYLVLISETFQKVLNNYLQLDLGIRWYILLAIIPLIPLGIGRRLKYLVPVSAAGVIFLIFGICVTFYYTLDNIPPISSRRYVSGIEELPLFVSTVLFAMEGVGTILPIENSMRNPGHFRGYCGMLSIAMTITIALYGSIGFFGYLKFGDETKANITLNLPHDMLSESVKILVALSTLFTYGLTISVPADIMWSRIEPSTNAQNETAVYYLMRLSLILGTVIIALAIPNLGPFISLVGSICLSILGLWTPALLELVTFWEDDFSYWRVVKNIFIMTCAVGALVTGTYTSMQEIIDNYT